MERSWLTPESLLRHGPNDMDLFQFVLFFSTIALLTIVPGPNFLLIVSTVTRVGKRGGYANVTGIALAFCCHGALAIGGASLILVQSEFTFTVVKCLGALYLCWLGIKSLRAALVESRRSAMRTCRLAPRGERLQSMVTGCREGFLTNALNPNTSLFYLAMFPQFISLGSGFGPVSALLVAMHVLVSASWFVVVIQLLDRVMAAFHSERHLRRFNVLSGCALIGIGGSFLVAAT